MDINVVIEIIVAVVLAAIIFFIMERNITNIKVYSLIGWSCLGVYLIGFPLITIYLRMVLEIVVEPPRWHYIISLAILSVGFGCLYKNSDLPKQKSNE